MEQQFVYAASCILSVAVVALSLLFRAMAEGKKKKGDLPPGPKGYPLVGALPLWKGPETNLQWTKEYGDIYSVKMGPRMNVYLNTIDLVNEYLIRNGSLYEDRPSGPAAIAQGLLFGSGSHWKLNKKLAGSVTWRDGAEVAFQRMFQSELDAILPGLSNKNPRWLPDVIRPYVSNVIIHVLRGKRYDENEPEFEKFLKIVKNLDDVNLISISTMMSLAFPKMFSVLRPNAPNLHEISKQVQAYAREWVRDTTQQQTEHTDKTFIETFTQSSEYKELTQDDKEMVQSMMDMFFGGVTSTMSVVEYLCLFLIHNPKIQTRLQEEVDHVLGTRPPTLSDRSKLPLVEAAILESLRLGSITPSSLPHVSVKDTEIGEYFVPQGTSVVASIYSLHMDEKYYENPEVFDPDRHIDKDGGIKKPTSFLPFGVGPRLCVGDTMVRVGVFMFLASVMQKYSIAPVGSESLPPFSARMRIVRRLEPFQVNFVSRNSNTEQTQAK